MKVVQEEPFYHEFKHAENIDEIPEKFGGFESIEEATDFVIKNFVAEHVTDVVKRLYTDDEISDLRLEVNHELEDERPLKEKEYINASMSFELAKTRKEEANEALNACVTRAKNISDDIKSGWTEFNLGANRSFRIAVNGRYYTYAYIDDGTLSLAKITIIPEHELGNLFNSVQRNEKSLKALYDEQIKAQKGEAK